MDKDNSMTSHIISLAELILSIKDFYSNEISKTCNIIISCKPFMKNIEKVREEYEFDRDLGFNFFTSISNTYYKENFHSDIIKYILDPRTPEIGNKIYLENFFKLINKINNMIIPKFDYDNIKICREIGDRENKIDILIYDNENAIIIENKINNAQDQKNQLARYIEYVKNQKKLNVIAIIYLVLTPDKSSNFNNYDNGYKKYIEEIEKKLVKISVISKDKMDFVHYFLNKCLNDTKNETAKVYINQYISLLKHIGGNEMSMEFEKKMMLEIYSDKEAIKVVNDLVSIWNRKSDILPILLLEIIKNKNLGFYDHPYKDGTLTVCKKIDDEISIGIDKYLNFGFVYTSDPKKGIPNEKRNKLIEILSSEEFNKFSYKLDKDNYYWVLRQFDLDKEVENINYIADEIIQMFNKLFEMYQKAFS